MPDWKNEMVLCLQLHMFVDFNKKQQLNISLLGHKIQSYCLVQHLAHVRSIRGINSFSYQGHCFHPLQSKGFKKGVGGGSQQTGELAGNFYCFLWRRITSSSSVCAVSQVCCSRPQSSVLKHMRQTALGNSRQPLKTSLRLIAFLFFPSLIVFRENISHHSAGVVGNTKLQ